jgi:hypothetical protein
LGEQLVSTSKAGCSFSKKKTETLKNYFQKLQTENFLLMPEIVLVQEAGHLFKREQLLILTFPRLMISFFLAPQ